MLRRKIGTFAVAAALLTGAFAGCGSGGQGAQAPNSQAPSAPSQAASKGEEKGAEGKTTLTLMRWGSTASVVSAAEAVLEKNPELAEKMVFEASVGGKGDGDVAQKCRLALAANEDMPDIVQMNYTQLPEFAQAGVLRDLGSVWADYEDKVAPGVLNIAKYGGKYVAFPGDPKCKLWFYRKDIFEEAGIDADAVKNVDDFIAAGKKVREKFPDSHILNLGPNFGGYDLYMQLSGNGARLSDEEGNYMADQDPNLRAALEDWKKIKDADISYNCDDFTPDWENAFANSTIVAELSANWMKRYLPDYAPEQAGKWAVAQYPQFAGAVGGSDAGADVYVIFNQAKNPELAIEYLTKLRLDKETSLAVEKAVNLNPILIEALEDPQMMEPDPYFGETLFPNEVTAMENLKVFNYTPAAQKEMDIMMPYVSKYINGEIDLDTALSSIQADLSGQIGNALNPK